MTHYWMLVNELACNGIHSTLGRCLIHHSVECLVKAMQSFLSSLVTWGGHAVQATEANIGDVMSVELCAYGRQLEASQRWNVAALLIIDSACTSSEIISKFVLLGVNWLKLNCTLELTLWNIRKVVWLSPFWNKVTTGILYQLTNRYTVLCRDCI